MTITAKEARALLEAERRKRAEACLQEIQAAIKAACNKHRCSFDVAMITTSRGSMFQLQAIPLDVEPPENGKDPLDGID